MNNNNIIIDLFKHAHAHMYFLASSLLYSDLHICEQNFGKYMYSEQAFEFEA